MGKAAAPVTFPEPDEPAKVQSDHVQDRTYFTEVGTGKGRRTVQAPCKGYRRASVLQRAKINGQLIDKSKCLNREATISEEFNAERRFAAGTRFTEAWLLANSANWAMGADMSRVRVAGIPGSFADHALTEKRFLENMRQALGVNDWMILRRVCGENCSVSEVVSEISPSYRYSTLSRFREALDALVLEMGL